MSKDKVVLWSSSGWAPWAAGWPPTCKRRASSRSSTTCTGKWPAINLLPALSGQTAGRRDLLLVAGAAQQCRDRKRQLSWGSRGGSLSGGDLLAEEFFGAGEDALAPLAFASASSRARRASTFGST